MGNHNRTIFFRSFITAVLMILLISTVATSRIHAQDEWHEIALLGRGSINQMALSPDGKFLATGGGLGIWLYDIETLEPFKLLQTHHDDIISFAFSPDSKQIAALGGSGDNNLHIWDIETETELLNIESSEDRNFRQMAFSPNGKLLATTSSDDGVKIWDAVTGEEVLGITDWKQVQHITFSPDSRMLVFSEYQEQGITYDYKVFLHVWDIANQQQVTEISTELASINRVIYSHDGKRLAITSDDFQASLMFWDTETWQQLDVLISSQQLLTAAFLPLNFSSDDQWVATAGYNPPGYNFGSESTVILAKIDTLDNLIELGTHPTHIVDVVFAQDGKTLFSASEEGILKVWDVETQTELTTLDQPVMGVLSATFSPDGQTFATANDYRMVQLWDTSSVNEVKVFGGESIGYGHFRPQTSSVMFSPDGNLLASSEGYNVFLWEVKTGNLRGSFSNGWGWTTTPTGFDMDEPSLAVTSSISMGNPAVVNTMSLDLMTMQPIVGLSADYEIEYGTEQVSIIAISNNGRFEASSGNGGMTSEGAIVDSIHVAVYSSHSQQGQVVIAVLPLVGGNVQYMEFSPNSSIFAAVDAVNTIHLWIADDFLRLEPPENAQEIATLQGHTAPVTDLIFSTNETRMASVDNSGTTRIWDLSNGGEIAHLTQQGWRFFSPSWQMLAINDSENTIHLWDLTTQSEIATFSRRQYGDLAFSPDEQTFAYQDGENRLHLWDINTQAEIAVIDGHIGSLRDIVFSPDSQTLLTVGNDSSIRVWRKSE